MGIYKVTTVMYYHWNVIGHAKELEILERDFVNGEVHHAYLFVGPEKIGKYRIAKTVAAILQCPNNFCHNCPACIQIEKKCHPDTIELADDGESVKIGIMREIIARLTMTGQSRHKVFLIQNAKRLTEEAANCILKILEEPPEKTVFIITANQLRDLPATVVSRMRVMHFKKLPDDVLRASLKELHPEVKDDVLDKIITLSLGRSGKALQLISRPDVFQELFDFYRQIQFWDEKASISTRFLAVKELSQDQVKTKTFLSLLSHYLRKKMLSAKTFDQRKKTISSLENIHASSNLLTRNVNPRLLLENIMIRL